MNTADALILGIMIVSILIPFAIGFGVVWLYLAINAVRKGESVKEATRYI